MLLFEGLAGLIPIVLWIVCFIDVLLTPESGCRNLPKLAWVFLVLLIPVVGSIAWLVAGRDWTRQGGPRATLGEPRARRVPSNPDDDQEFLDSLRRRADEQRRRAREGQDGSDGGAA